MKTVITLTLALLSPVNAWAQLSNSPIPEFTATALTGEKVSAAQLIGQPTILIVTPSTDAAKHTRLWAKALRKNIDQTQVRIRDVLAIDLPFFMSEEDAIGRAKEKIPARYQDQTWILSESSLESALNIPRDSARAFVFVLDAQGTVIARVEGAPDEAKIREVEMAVGSTH
ncbi:TlpA family protein disulfide reductase [Pseudomonas sp. GWSMS-1]|uniref:TlpA family protein disulfide reductase n=1 Tax=Pseudomonas sp. GWSMS-1 TaxID=3308997 RepID=UPI003CFAA790